MKNVSRLLLAVKQETLHVILWRCVGENVFYWPADNSFYKLFLLP